MMLDTLQTECSKIVTTDTEQQLEAATVQRHTIVMLAVYSPFTTHDSNGCFHVSSISSSPII